MKHQSLGRALTTAEQTLADAMLAFFRTGATDFDAMAADLQSKKIPRPSGETAPWTKETLKAELETINAALDEAYEKNVLF